MTKTSIEFLADRLVTATEWLAQNLDVPKMPMGYFGASTGAGAALIAAARRPQAVDAIVSRGGRPDMAGSVLPQVQAPTLLIVGGNDAPVIEMNKQALAQLEVEKKLEIIESDSTRQKANLENRASLIEHEGRMSEKADNFQATP
ncbi:MAG: hypothetical protein RLP02_17795 [Coleofasciculus sp. C2-GNP5-27]